ncbi:MAG: methylated DNA-protein cysteine methyltransferase, partial [Clostridiales bacterium]|nr:methylated DNA-protein cysteine methyltransferase [Clostridiales bacterium]
MAAKDYNKKLEESKNQIVKVDQSNMGTKAVVPAYLYDEVIRKIPEGKVVTTEAIRMFFAAKHHAMVTCPLTTGNAILLIANATEERGKDPSPY